MRWSQRSTVVSANDWIDNICRGDEKLLIKAELDFLRHCFERVLGRHTVAAISDEMRLKRSMFQILSLHPGTTTAFDWTNSDPILALQAITEVVDREPWFEIGQCEGQRWTK